MFLHSYKYALLTQLRNRTQLFWCFAFPILLGFMFNFAFSGLDADEQFDAIPVAVVVVNEAGEQLPYIQDVLAQVSEKSENRLLEIVKTSGEEEALALLERKEITGIFYIENELSLTVNAMDNGQKLNQSILSSFVEQFHMEYQGIVNVLQNHPENMENILSLVEKDKNYLKETSIGMADMSMKLSYYYNLIAMTCLYAAMVGLSVTIHFQANLSKLGARKSVSSMHRLVGLFGELLSAVTVNFCTLLISLCVYHFAFGVNLGSQIGYTLLGILVGCITGVAFGFFIGSIGTFSADVKFAIMIAGTMCCSILSGLMISEMRLNVEKVCPILNRINPAALISDTFFSLAVYPSHERYFQNIGSLAVISMIFLLGGLAMIRRKKYANV